jgi:hypothetical protein
MMYFMLAYVVNYRSHPRQPDLFRTVRPTPLFPSSPVSPLLPISYSYTYTTATHQPLWIQSLTRSFHHDGEVYPLLPLRLALKKLKGPLHPPSIAQEPQFTGADPHSIQQLTKCSSRNPFLLITIHFHGGGYTPFLVPSTCRRSDDGEHRVD